MTSTKASFSSDCILSVCEISKRYPSLDVTRGVLPYILSSILGHKFCRFARIQEPGYTYVLNSIKFDIAKGERVGLIGANGSGKSTLLKLISRVVRPTTGNIVINGSVVSLLEVGTGFNEDLSGYKNIFYNASLYGMAYKKVLSKIELIVDFADLNEHIHKPLKYYSSGMKMRLAFAIAAHLESDLLLLDEVLAVGDIGFQQKCLERVDNIATSGRTIILVSHSMDSIIRYTDRCLWLESGKIVADGPSKEVVKLYLAKYTKVKSSFVVNKPDAGEVSPPEAANKLDGTLGYSDIIDFSILAIDCAGAESTVFEVDSEVTLSITFISKSSGLCVPSIRVRDSNDSIVFTSYPSQYELDSFWVYHGGITNWSVAIPANLLNTSLYSIDITLFDPRYTPFHRFVNLHSCLCLQIVESADPDSLTAKGLLPRSFPGPIRPQLQWILS